jgi:hypothetical protein
MKTGGRKINRLLNIEADHPSHIELSMFQVERMAEAIGNGFTEFIENLSLLQEKLNYD